MPTADLPLQRHTVGGAAPRKRQRFRRDRSALALGALVSTVAAVVFVAYHDAGKAAAVARPAVLAQAPLNSAAGRGVSKRKTAPPSAAEFAAELIGAATHYGEQVGDSKRIDDADCVQAAPGRYMCSYAVIAPGTPRACHIMQARWTPQLASPFVITLAGTTARCSSLREALASLR